MNPLHSRGLAIAGASLALALALAGCSFAGTGGDSGQSDTPDGGTTTSPPGAVNLDDFQGVPATFPSDVPIIDGNVPVGVDLGTGWSIVVEVDDYAASYTEASGKLTGAGFDTLQDGTSGDGSFGAFQNDKYQVQVTATDTADYGPAVSYVVVKNG